MESTGTLARILLEETLLKKTPTDHLSLQTRGRELEREAEGRMATKIST
ncbi:hypothetical protein [Nostoc sp. C052]|nr:hypothetical protein [Nostoc sp. C052]